jgi:sulfur-carrier protein
MPRNSSTSTGTNWFQGSPDHLVASATNRRAVGSTVRRNHARTVSPTAPGQTAPLAAILRWSYNCHVPTTKDTNAMRLTVLFFGRLKDTIGHGEESLEIAVGSRIEDVFRVLAARYPEWAAHRKAMAVSRNQEFAAWATPLEGGDEVAFLPPVSGG